MTPIPRSEHPRPALTRDQWINLNGSWRFAFDPDLVGEQMGWHRPDHTKDLTITVPYPWESKLSGIAAPDYKGAAWYEREITIPDDWQGLAPYLNFGAIDWAARVWINGRLAAEHENGYLPFSVDLRPYTRPGETVTVTVRAFDVADAATLVGKQVPRWYTYSSGIWQTVWLEGRAPSHITGLRVTPDVEHNQAAVQVSLSVDSPGTYRLHLQSTEDGFAALDRRLDLDAGQQQVSLTLPVPDPQLWSPETPHLYNFVAELEPESGMADRVQSYFGMRSVGRGAWNGKEYEYILLNGEPVYLRGALDQAFHPDGLHTYPSDDVIRDDIQLAKDLGLNMLRCHIKVNDPRYYYWADRLGLLMMYDLPSPDLDSPSMRRTFEHTLRGAIDRDFNSPSIFAWVIFNETWGLSNHDTLEGQRWVQQMYRLTKELDSTRLAEDNSPNKYDHVESDINSWHFYINDYHRARQHIERVVEQTYSGSDFNYVGGEFVQGTAPLMNSEYAGISARMGDQDIAWSFKYLTTDLRRHDKVCGYVYTELDDIEWEHNGFVNYDRSSKEFGYDFFVPEMSVVDLNGADFVGLDAPPCQTLTPGAEFRAPLFISHWGVPMSTARVRWQLDFMDRLGSQRTVHEGSLSATPQRFAVTILEDLTISLPAESGLATVALWLEDETGAVRGRNYVNVEVRGENASRAEQLSNGWALHIDPAQFSQASVAWPHPFAEPDGGKFSAQGSGWVEYEVPLPSDLNVDSVQGLRLLFEAGAKAGMARVDWPQQLNGTNYPQTETEKKYPTDLTVSINGTTLGDVHLPDDPADARGVLSHHRSVDPGSYGYLMELSADVGALAHMLDEQRALQVRFTVPDDAKHPGGLSLYGSTLGCYPLDPTLILETNQ